MDCNGRCLGILAPRELDSAVQIWRGAAVEALAESLELVVLRFLLNSTEETDCFWPNPITLCYLTITSVQQKPVRYSG